MPIVGPGPAGVGDPDSPLTMPPDPGLVEYADGAGGSSSTMLPSGIASVLDLSAG